MSNAAPTEKTKKVSRGGADAEEPGEEPKGARGAAETAEEGGRQGRPRLSAQGAAEIVDLARKCPDHLVFGWAELPEVKALAGGLKAAGLKQLAKNVVDGSPALAVRKIAAVVESAEALRKMEELAAIEAGTTEVE